ncbi:MAG: hypothetical protein AMJ79_00155 [Phycisphaerae bacterium SM23_30]|nr:MAG: hypothetical protein AMJ79_00155 [Phycisphaerae bacterium SM23_30]
MAGKTALKISVVVLMVLFIAGPAFGQFAGEVETPTDWQVSFVSGYFSGGGLLSTRVGPQNELVKVEAHSAWLAGLRFGADQEYLGWEITAAGAFADLHVKAAPQDSLSSGRDLNVFLGDLNALLFPAGNSLANGRLRPFITAGGGVAHFDSNFDEIGAETAFDVNAGAGLKVLLGETGKYHLRLDWRWHYMTGGGKGIQENLYRQELTLGLGIRF